MSQGELLFTRIKELAVQTGFTEGSEPTSLKHKLPKGSALLVSNYSVLIVVFVEERTSEALLSIKESAESVIDEILILMENKGMLLDGYLLIAINTEPDDLMLNAIRKVELSSSVCRKHVIWPKGKGEGKWDNRLRYVTVLGLPSTVESIKLDFEETVLPEKAQEVLLMHENKNTYKNIVDFIEKKLDVN